MRIHNFYADLLLSLRYLFDNILGKNYVKTFRVDIASRSLIFKDLRSDLEYPLAYASIGSPDRLTNLNTPQSPSPLDELVVKDLTHDVSLYYQSKWCNVPISVTFSCETYAQCKEIEYQFFNVLPVNKYITFYEYISFLPIPDNLICFGCSDELNFKEEYTYHRLEPTPIRDDNLSDTIDVPPYNQQPISGDVDNTVYEKFPEEKGYKFDVVKSDIIGLYIHITDEGSQYRFATLIEPLIMFTGSAPVKGAESQVELSFVFLIPMPHCLIIDPYKKIENVFLLMNVVDSSVSPSFMARYLTHKDNERVKSFVYRQWPDDVVDINESKYHRLILVSDNFVYPIDQFIYGSIFYRDLYYKFDIHDGYVYDLPVYAVRRGNDIVILISESLQIEPSMLDPLIVNLFFLNKK